MGRFSFSSGMAAEIAHRLEMDSPYMRPGSKSEFDDGPYAFVVHPRHDGRYQHHPQARFSTMADGSPLFLEERSSPEGDVRTVVDAVELEKYGGESRRFQGSGQSRVPRQAKPFVFT